MGPRNTSSTSNLGPLTNRFWNAKTQNERTPRTPRTNIEKTNIEKSNTKINTRPNLNIKEIKVNTILNGARHLQITQ
jgi:hypothetical protein